MLSWDYYRHALDTVSITFWCSCVSQYLVIYKKQCLASHDLVLTSIKYFIFPFQLASRHCFMFLFFFGDLIDFGPTSTTVLRKPTSPYLTHLELCPYISAQSQTHCRWVLDPANIAPFLQSCLWYSQTGSQYVGWGEIQVQELQNFISAFRMTWFSVASSVRDLQYALGCFAAEFKVTGTGIGTVKSEATVLCCKTVDWFLSVGWAAVLYEDPGSSSRLHDEQVLWFRRHACVILDLCREKGAEAKGKVFDGQLSPVIIYSGDPR